MANDTAKKYSLKYSGNSKIAASLTKVCECGGLGEPLIRNGLNQGTFAKFLANWAKASLESSGGDTDKLALQLERLSATNCSAAQKALGDVTIEVEGAAKPQSVSAFWGKVAQSGSAAPDTSIFEL
jgi:hypothetical protein